MPELEVRYDSQQPGERILIFRISVDEKNIGVKAEPLGALLIFPLQVGPVWRSLRRELWRDKGLSWKIIGGTGALRWSNRQNLAASLPISVNQNGALDEVKFPLTLSVAEELETFRNGGDVIFTLDITFNVAQLAEVCIQTRSTNSAEKVIEKVILSSFRFPPHAQ